MKNWANNTDIKKRLLSFFRLVILKRKTAAPMTRSEDSTLNRTQSAGEFDAGSKQKKEGIRKR